MANGQTLGQLAQMGTERTELSPALEMMFRGWAQRAGITDVDAPNSRYDYRGYWLQQLNQPPPARPIQFGRDHFPDTFKQHGHPTFSVESKYSRGPSDGGRWLTEDVLVAPPMASHKKR